MGLILNVAEHLHFPLSSVEVSDAQYFSGSDLITMILETIMEPSLTSI